MTSDPDPANELDESLERLSQSLDRFAQVFSVWSMARVFVGCVGLLLLLLTIALLVSSLFAPA